VLIRSLEASVPTLGNPRQPNPRQSNPRQPNRGIDWPAIARTLLVQVVVLLALSGAFIFYLNWSSDVAWQEFLEASEPSVADPNHHAQSSAPVQTVKGQIAACPRKP
jgi:hypothetical protein